METKAHHVLIGSFVLVFVAAIFAFIIWLARVDVNKGIAVYDVFFSSSVAGLGVGGDVRFNGIKVGSVTDIDIDRDDPRNVRVRVQIDASTPIRADSIAELQLQGITGVSYVQINPGSQTAAMLDYVPGKPPPVIPSRPSRIAELFEGAPDLLNHLIELVDRATNLLNPDSQRDFAAILANVSKVTGAVAAREAEIGRIVQNVDSTAADIGTAAKSIREFVARMDKIAASADQTLIVARQAATHFDGVVDRDLRALITDTRGTMREIDKLARQLDGVVADNREPIKAFTTEGLTEFRQLIDDARVMVAALSRVANRIEDNPGEIIFGSRESNFRPGGN